MRGTWLGYWGEVPAMLFYTPGSAPSSSKFFLFTKENGKTLPFFTMAFILSKKIDTIQHSKVKRSYIIIIIQPQPSTATFNLQPSTPFSQGSLHVKGPRLWPYQLENLWTPKKKGRIPVGNWSHQKPEKKNSHLKCSFPTKITFDRKTQRVHIISPKKKKETAQ